jgi:hypothetical protein
MRPGVPRRVGVPGAECGVHDAKCGMRSQEGIPNEVALNTQRRTPTEPRPRHSKPIRGVRRTSEFEAGPGIRSSRERSDRGHRRCFERPTLNAELPMNHVLAGVGRSQGRGGLRSWTFGVRCSAFDVWLAEAQFGAQERECPAPPGRGPAVPRRSPASSPSLMLGRLRRGSRYEWRRTRLSGERVRRSFFARRQSLISISRRLAEDLSECASAKTSSAGRLARVHAAASPALCSSRRSFKLFVIPT